MDRWKVLKNHYNRCWTKMHKRRMADSDTGPGQPREHAGFRILANFCAMTEHISWFGHWERNVIGRNMGRLLIGDWPRTTRVNRHHARWLESRGKLLVRRPPSRWDFGLEAVKKGTAVDELARCREGAELVAPLWHFPSGTPVLHVEQWINDKRMKYGIR